MYSRSDPSKFHRLCDLPPDFRSTVPAYALAEQLVAITLAVVATSIVVHGISVTPLMVLYARRAKAKDAAMPR
jgi:NhaP-type Na+/H+ or K+/H+ antiporter